MVPIELAIFITALVVVAGALLAIGYLGRHQHEVRFRNRDYVFYSRWDEGGWSPVDFPGMED